MPTWLQHTLVLALVAICVAAVAREAVKALRRKASRLAGCGECKGCETQEADKHPDQTPATATPGAARVAFLPADSLTARVASRYKR